MVKVTMNIEGMACPMCQAKVERIVKEKCKVESISVSHESGVCEFTAKAAPDEDALHQSIEDFGYTVKSYDCTQEEKKRFSLFRK